MVSPSLYSAIPKLAVIFPAVGCLFSSILSFNFCETSLAISADVFLKSITNSSPPHLANKDDGVLFRIVFPKW